MKESLRIADDTRRLHSDSTKLVRGDRGSEPLDQPEALRELLSGVTKENQHAEIDFGAPVGKEKC
jgi:antitoxin component of MazEF toxin-antitoxin module